MVLENQKHPQEVHIVKQLGYRSTGNVCWHEILDIFVLLVDIRL